ncbi:hypothetical protein JMN32_23525 [Fulvivirga sp. 29W222]|uniref:Uncharacterized protein n=1 Tax=Fulvivirga marina TaxID=2494733 RepID=A0A937G2Z6_9BACT|nr:hypothetical protein [Fulvivirga marina]MBL6449301.1 hypothetical protein [Fulvivirga marina]
MSKKKMDIQKVKDMMLSKMGQANLKGGFKSNDYIIAGCCTQGCCEFEALR